MLEMAPCVKGQVITKLSRHEQLPDLISMRSRSTLYFLSIYNNVFKETDENFLMCFQSLK